MSNKRVTLTYTVDLDDLEAEVNRLHGRMLTLLTRCVEEAASPLGDTLSLVMVERLDALRKDLARADYMLADIGKIIGGYVSYQVEEATENVTPTAPAPAINDLQDKLNTIQEMIAQNGLPVEKQGAPTQSD